jgi:uncharacterized protein YndB with AHSA1/START domain
MHAKDSIHIDAPVEKVDRLALDPDGWARYFVGMSAPDEIVGDGGAGTRVGYTMRAGGAHWHSVARVVERRRDPDGSLHWRAEILEGTPGWETWDLVPEDGGTSVTEEMKVRPYGVVGKLGEHIFVERMLRRIVHQSLENLKRLVESD